MGKVVHNTKTSLREEAKVFLPQIKKLYPDIDDTLLDRVSKWCVVYSDSNEDVKVAIRRWEEAFGKKL